MKLPFLLGFLCLLLACQKKESAKTIVVPEGMIQRSAMKEILKDIHKVEVLSRDKHLKLDTNFAQSSVGWYYEEVYKQHGVSEQQFKHSFDYYTLHFKQFMAMYDEMITEMQEDEKALKELDRQAREAAEAAMPEVKVKGKK